MKLSKKKEVIQLLERRIRSGLDVDVCVILDLEVNRIKRMTDDEFEAYARRATNSPKPNADKRFG